MQTLTLSGWGQPFDALSCIAPNALHSNYAKQGSLDGTMQTIAQEGKERELVIGWSLGGQLAVRAVAQGLLKPKRLVLIGAPYQFVETPQLKLGMKRDAYDKFRNNYARNPERTLDKAWELVIKDDKFAEKARGQINDEQKARALEINWLQWLDLLDGFSCVSLDFSNFPPTLVVHGRTDVVVKSEQADYFGRAIPNVKISIWDACGHAPHWHNTPRLMKLIAEHTHV